MPATVTPRRLLLPFVLIVALLAAVLPAGGTDRSPAWVSAAERPLALVSLAERPLAVVSLAEWGGETLADDPAAMVDVAPWFDAMGPEDVDGAQIVNALPIGRHAIGALLPVVGMAPHPPGPRFPTGPPHSI